MLQFRGLIATFLQITNSRNYFLVMLNLFFNYLNYNLNHAAQFIILKQRIVNGDER